VIHIPGYKTWATNDIPTAADFNELFADPQQADVNTSENTTSTSFGDLTTPGPSLTKTLVNGQKVLVLLWASNLAITSSQQSWASFAVSGASTQAASDINGAWFQEPTSGPAIPKIGSRGSVFTATASGSHTFTEQYRTSSANTSTFARRRIIIKPF
jgi:hypothetical protein